MWLCIELETRQHFSWRTRRDPDSPHPIANGWHAVTNYVAGYACCCNQFAVKTSNDDRRLTECSRPNANAFSFCITFGHVVSGHQTIEMPRPDCRVRFVTTGKRCDARHEWQHSVCTNPDAAPANEENENLLVFLVVATRRVAAFYRYGCVSVLYCRDEDERLLFKRSQVFLSSAVSDGSLDGPKARVGQREESSRAVASAVFRKKPWLQSRGNMRSVMSANSRLHAFVCLGVF